MNLKFRKNTAIYFFFIAFFGFTSWLQAQDLSLQMALDSALANSLTIKNLDLKIQGLEIAKKASFNLGNLNIAFQNGQTQGLNTDYTLTLNQTISNPVLQSKKKKEAQALLEREEKKRELSKKSIERDVKSAWYEWQYASNLIKVYENQIKITEKALQKAEKQVELGEIAQSELALLKIRQEQLMYDLSQVKIANIQAKKQVLSLCLLQNKVKIEASDFTIIAHQNTFSDLPNEDLLAYQQANNLYKKQQVKTAKAKYLPDFSIGYFTQSMDKMGGFDGFQVGISIPILQNNQAVKRANIDTQIAENELEITRQNMNYYYRELLAKKKQYSNYYDTHIKNWSEQSQILKKALEKELELGEIDYLRFVQINQQAFDFELKKLEIIDKINQSLILIQYFN